MAGVVIDTSVLDNILSKLDVNAGAVVQKLAQDTEVYMKTHMSTSSPSLPGEPPAIDTSTLVNSIDAIPESEKVWLTVVGRIMELIWNLGRCTCRRVLFPPGDRMGGE